MSVMPWSDYDQMMSIANGLEYGLTASIVTNDRKCAQTAERLECGYVWINPRAGIWVHCMAETERSRSRGADELFQLQQIKNVNLRW
jgi:acyl-CoA reductase-like NAD-dependent aldehyde dehydrogenase